MALGCERVRELAPGFVLEALDPADMRAIREHLATCTKPHPELRELGGVVPYLATAIEPVEPPERLRAAIVAAAQADLRARSRSDRAAERLVASFSDRSARTARSAAPVAPLLDDSPAAEAPAPARAGAKEPVAVSEAAPRRAPVISLSAARASRSRRLMWFVRAAAAVLIVALGARAVILESELKDARVASDEQAKISVMVKQPGTVAGTITPENGSQAGGIVLLQPTGHVYVSLSGLDATSGHEVYVLWMAADQGNLTVVTSFTVDKTGNAHLEVEKAPVGAKVRVAVSKEPREGAAKPSTPLVASGTISQ